MKRWRGPSEPLNPPLPCTLHAAHITSRPREWRKPSKTHGTLSIWILTFSTRTYAGAVALSDPPKIPDNIEPGRDVGGEEAEEADAPDARRRDVLPRRFVLACRSERAALPILLFRRSGGGRVITFEASGRFQNGLE